MTAEIITIGDEILIGQIIDTNSAWLASELDKIGVSIIKIISISDKSEAIFNALENSGADLILLTGGLGPTADDITKPVLAEFFETRLVHNKTAFENMQNFVLQRGMKLNKGNKEQALLPENCTVIPNKYGTATAMMFQKAGKRFISMPGVPFEMKNIFTEEILPIIKENYTLDTVIHKNIPVFGVPESVLAERLVDFEKMMPENLNLAYLPSPERVLLRLSIAGNDKNLLNSIIKEKNKELKNILGNDIFASENIFLEELVGKKLKKAGQTVSTAESCTGGNIAKLITSISGSSEYFEGGVVAYSNRIKNEILGVKELTLMDFGAVSKETVEEMAVGIMKLYGSDYGIAVSGIAGPGGASPGKPVGTVWIAVASKNKLISEKYSFGNLRDVTVRRASATALNMLRKILSHKTSRRP